MYKIIGADGRPYGPVTADQLREWIASGRANGQTMVQVEGAADWKPLSSFPEFASALASAPPSPSASSPPVVNAVDPIELADEILRREYTLDIGSCFSRAWELVTSDFWPIVGTTALMFVLIWISSSALVGLLVLGPLVGGLYWYYLKLIRGEAASLQDAFAGFPVAFVPLMLTGVVSVLLESVGLLLCILPGIYLYVAWTLALPLVIDKRLEFWDAMEVSRKVINRRWWSFFALNLLWVLINIGGILLCVVGVFVTLPVTTLALAYAYNDIFGRTQSQTP